MSVHSGPSAGGADYNTASRDPAFRIEAKEDATYRVQVRPEFTYDDAGVACDRLGRGDEAISWMERKRGTGDMAGPIR